MFRSASNLICSQGFAVKHTIAMLVLAATAMPALAAPPLYVGLRAGGDLGDRLDHFGGNIKTDTIYGGFVGARLNDAFAFEVGASNLGSAERGAADYGIRLDGALYQMGVVGTLPLTNKFHLIGAIGAFRLEEDGSSGTFAGPVDIDNSGGGAYVEVGGRYRMNEQWSLRSGYSWYDFELGDAGHLWGGIQLDL